MTATLASKLSLLDSRAAIGVVCLFLGLGLLATVGFAGPHAVHNAAHDTRHAIGFPCH